MSRPASIAGPLALFSGDASQNEEALVTAFDKIEMGAESGAGEAQQNIMDDMTRLRACGEGEENGPSTSDVERTLLDNGTLLLLVTFLPRFTFEARKEVCKLFETLLSRNDALTARIVEHINQTPAIIDGLFQGYTSNAAVISGTILRACIKHKPLAIQILRTEGFWSLFVHMKNNNFDVASDAATTFKELLVKDETKKMTAEFLGDNYDRFCNEYSVLLSSKAPEAYFARRQLLKLLGEMLLDRTNFNVMKRYIQSAEHLKLMMTLFKDQSDHIKLEAFNVFKVFVANPEKAPAVLDILQRNRDRLIQYFEAFKAGSLEDEQFREEKQLVIEEIRKIQTDDNDFSS